MSKTLDHPGWAEALAGIETERSRALVKLRAKDMDSRSLRTMTQDQSIACCFPAWKLEIWKAELLRRPEVLLEKGRDAA